MIHIFKQKLTQIKKILKKYDANQIIMQSKDPNFYWLFQTKISKATLIITKKETHLITKPLEYINKEFKNKVNIIPVKKSTEIKKISKQKIKGKTLLNYSEITIKDIDELNIKKTKNIEEELTNLREIKTKQEIQKIKTACNHVVKCWKQIIKNLKQKELKTEKQILQHIKKYALNNELELAFNPVVASGNNAGTPHHEPQKTLKKGFLVIDMGFSYKGYKSDMTRTIYLGEPTKKEKEIYNELLQIQEELIRRTKPRKKAQKLYEKTKKMMKTPELFIHGLGHGVGIQIHEKPNITEKTEDTIKENQILTIEPGYYTNKYGIRIEDTILVGKTNEILTKKAPKKLKIIR